MQPEVIKPEGNVVMVIETTTAPLPSREWSWVQTPMSAVYLLLDDMYLKTCGLSGFGKSVLHD